LKIVKWPHLNEKSYDFDEIWYTTADLKLDGRKLVVWP